MPSYPCTNNTQLPTTETPAPQDLASPQNSPTEYPTLGDPGATQAPTSPISLAPQTNAPTNSPTTLFPPTNDPTHAPTTVPTTESPTSAPHTPTISPSSSTSEPTFYPTPQFGPSFPPTRPGTGSQPESGSTPSGYAPFTSGTFSAGVTVAFVSKVFTCVLLFLAINV
jgi:hypothetical protein